MLLITCLCCSCFDLWKFLPYKKKKKSLTNGNAHDCHTLLAVHDQTLEAIAFGSITQEEVWFDWFDLIKLEAFSDKMFHSLTGQYLWRTPLRTEKLEASFWKNDSPLYTHDLNI